MSKKLKSRGRGTFPWEYDALVASEDSAKRKRGRRKQKALSKLEKQRQRIRRAKQHEGSKPHDSGNPKTIRVWPQGWRVPTPSLPLTAKEYARYLETPHWREFRDRYRASDRLQECFVCGGENFELHHHTYVRLGQEEFEDVVPLCATHHHAVHKAVKSGVKLANAHTYVRMRYQRGELGVKIR